ncbi:MAG: cell division protein ZapB [Dongiaceae bacterium]
MSLGLHDRQQRQRRRMMWSAVKWGVAMALVFVSGLYAYQTGTSLARIDLNRLEQKVADLSQTIDGLRNENAELKATRADAEQRAVQWEQRYQAEVPSGRAKAIYDLAQQKIKDGVDPGRLAFIIGAAANPRVCDEPTESRTIMVRTSINKTGKNSASFANRTVTATAEGQPVVNDAGQKEAWFDTAQPVMLRFAEIGGQTTEAAGILPLQQDWVVGDSEFRFNILAEERRGFVTITAERCNFP